MWKPKLKKLELTKLVCVGFVVISQSTFAKDLQCKKDYESIISKNIVAMNTAFNNGDWQYIENKTDTTLINYAGGKEAYKGLLALAVDTFKKDNILVLFSTDLKSKPIEELKKTIEFLGVKPFDFTIKNLHEREYVEEINEETKQKIKEYFKEPNLKLSELLGKKITWHDI